MTDQHWPVCGECDGRHAPTKPGMCSGTADGKYSPPWGSAPPVLGTGTTEPPGQHSDQLAIINATGCTVRQAEAFLTWHRARIAALSSGETTPADGPEGARIRISTGGQNPSSYNGE